MNPCETYEALLDLYLDGECSPEEAERVQAHIKECSACQAYIDEMLAIRAAFPSAEDTAVPAGFAEGVMAAVRATPQKKAKKTPWAKVLLPLAACCAIVVLLQDVSGPNMKFAAPEAYVATTESASVVYDMAAPTAEEAPAEAAPAAPAPEAEMPAAKGALAPQEDAVMDSANEPMEAAPYRIRITVDADYIGDALADYAPVTEAELPEGRTELHYELTMVQYEALLEALADRDELPAEEEFETDSDLVLVIVR